MDNITPPQSPRPVVAPNAPIREKRKRVFSDREMTKLIKAEVICCKRLKFYS